MHGFRRGPECDDPFVYSFAALAESDTCIDGYGGGYRYGRLGVSYSTTWGKPEAAMLLPVR
jgi:hypothetical protein